MQQSFSTFRTNAKIRRGSQAQRARLGPKGVGQVGRGSRQTLVWCCPSRSTSCGLDNALLATQHGHKLTPKIVLIKYRPAPDYFEPWQLMYLRGHTTGYASEQQKNGKRLNSTALHAIAKAEREIKIAILIACHYDPSPPST